MDVAEQARLKAKQVEIATAIREKVGVDVSANAEVGAKVVEKMLGEYVEKGKGGVEEALRAMGGAPNLTAKEQKG